MTFQLKEKQIIEKIQKFLVECDADELAGLTGKLFGGFCEYFMDGEYLFTPDENYMGAFGEDENEDSFDRDWCEFCEMSVNGDEMGNCPHCGKPVNEGENSE